ncbi:MAG TPA: hypothetical protein VME45_08620 [Stellaceae bacterium]|nr:hypothetical protein [Stellaceae bacterium]
MATDTEPVGLLTEGAAGIAAIVLSIIALAGVSSSALASIAAIVIGVGLMVQGFNTAAENLRLPPVGGVAEFGGEVMVDFLGGGAGIVLGVLGLIGLSPAYLLAAALIVFGGALLLSGALSLRTRVAAMGPTGQMIAMSGSAATGGVELLMGTAAVVLGILALVAGGPHAAILLLVGYIVVGAAMLIVSATFGAALMRVFAQGTVTAE